MDMPASAGWLSPVRIGTAPYLQSYYFMDFNSDHVNGGMGEQHYLNKAQLRAFAAAMRQRGLRAADFVSGILGAKQFLARQLHGEIAWRQIAEEMSIVETSEILTRHLARQKIT
jgi:hypothetical protein